MKFRTRTSPLILLLLPSLAVALADTTLDSETARRSLVTARDAGEPEPNALNGGTRREVPTKDAPVDGKDGKPHLGPFVAPDISTGGDLSDLTLKGKPSDWKTHEGKEIPESNDGVMFDKNRERPQEGTTGTEGGVTEKERNRKAQEGMVGGKLQTQPEAPKEQPPLPHSEEERIKNGAKDGSKSEDDTSYTGLDVSVGRMVFQGWTLVRRQLTAIFNRNQTIFPTSQATTTHLSPIPRTRITWTFQVVHRN